MHRILVYCIIDCVKIIKEGEVAVKELKSSNSNTLWCMLGKWCMAKNGLG